MEQEYIAEDSQDHEVDDQESNAELETENESLETDGEEQPEEGQEEAEDDSEEIEFNDKKFKLPKDIAEGVKSMRKDYTEKTMAVADQRKALEERTQFFEQFSSEAAQLKAISNQLVEFKQLDWNTLFQNDSTLANQLQRKEKELIDQRTELMQTVAHKDQLMKHERQQELAKSLESSEAVLRREIKGWSPDFERKLQDFAIDTFGFSSDDVKASKADPRIYKLIYKAFLGDQLSEKQTSKPKPEGGGTVTVLKGKGAVTSKNPAQMSDAEYQKWRRKGYS